MVHGEFWVWNDEILGQDSSVGVTLDLTLCYSMDMRSFLSPFMSLFLEILGRHFVLHYINTLFEICYTQFKSKASNKDFISTLTKPHRDSREPPLLTSSSKRPRAQVPEPRTGFHPDPHIEFPNPISTSSMTVKTLSVPYL